MRSAIALIGVGNPWRRDDGVGWAVVATAGRLVGDDVEVVETDGEPSRLLDAWTGVDLAVVVDAVCSGAEPGTIHVWRDGPELAHASPPAGSHALGLAHGISLGRALHRMPRTLVIVGIEVEEIFSGHGLSAAVAAVVDETAGEIARIVTDWRAAGQADQAGSKATSSAAPGVSE